jgi:hypothetical protein
MVMIDTSGRASLISASAPAATRPANMQTRTHGSFASRPGSVARPSAISARRSAIAGAGGVDDPGHAVPLNDVVSANRSLKTAKVPSVP